jgi:hypothetical protein
MADEIIIKYGADVNKLENELDKVESDLRGIDKAADKSMKNLSEESNKSAKDFKKVDKEVRGLKDQLKDLAERMPFVSAAKEVGELAKSMRGATTSTDQSSSAFKRLRIAIVSTGIGALVVALGAVVTYFLKTEKGAEKVEKWFAQIGVTVDVLIGRFARLGQGLVEFFTGDWEKATETFSQAFIDIGKEIAEATEAAGEYTEELQQIEDAEKLLRVEMAKRRNEIQKLIIESRNLALTDKQRLAKLEEAEKIETEIIDKQIGLAERKVKALEKENAIKLKTQELDEGNKTDELIDAEVELENLRGNSLELLAKIQVRKEALRDSERDYGNALARAGKISKLTSTMQTKTEGDYTEAQKKEAKKRHDSRVKEMKIYQKEVVEPMQKAAEDAAKEEEEREYKLAEAKKNARKQGLMDSIALLGETLMLFNEAQLREANEEIEVQRNKNNEQLNEQISNLQKRKDAELISDKQFEAQKAILQKQAAKKEHDLKVKAFEAEKKAKLISIGIEVAVGIAKAAAQLLPSIFTAPLFPFVAAAIAGQGAVQALFVAKQKPPRFKEGVIELQGKGTGTSDSIPAMLSKGESVMTAEETREHKSLFNAIRKKKFDEYINNNYLAPVIAKEREKQRIAEKRQEEMSGWVRSFGENGMDLSHLERLTKKNKAVRIENVKEFASEIGRNIKPYKSQGL